MDTPLPEQEAIIKIYVAHSYGRRRGESLETLQRNVNESIRFGLALIKLGHNPFIPNLYHYVHLMADGSITEDTFIDLMTEWVKQCDAILVASELTHGVRIEIGVAKEMGIPIYYSLEELSDKCLKESQL